VQERGAVAPLSGGRAGRVVLTGAVAAAVVVADQVTTSWAVADLRRPVHLFGPLGLALQYNSGTAFSLFSGVGVWLSVVVAAVVVGLGWLAWRADGRLSALAFGLVLGGALGNLADRLFRAHHGDVADFVTLSHWPTFNVADACITVGVVLLAVGYLWGPHQRTGREATTDGASGRPAGRPASGAPGARAHDAHDEVEAVPAARQPTRPMHER
jgi:signal peptidase II